MPKPLSPPSAATPPILPSNGLEGAKRANSTPQPPGSTLNPLGDLKNPLGSTPSLAALQAQLAKTPQAPPASSAQARQPEAFNFAPGPAWPPAAFGQQQAAADQQHALSNGGSAPAVPGPGPSSAAAAQLLDAEQNGAGGGIAPDASLAERLHSHSSASAGNSPSSGVCQTACTAVSTTIFSELVAPPKEQKGEPMPVCAQQLGRTPKGLLGTCTGINLNDAHRCFMPCSASGWAAPPCSIEAAEHHSDPMGKSSWTQ